MNHEKIHGSKPRRTIPALLGLLLIWLLRGDCHAQGLIDPIGYPLTSVGGGGTDTKPESKCWFAEGSWWCVLLDGDDNYLYRYDGHTTWTKQLVPGIVNPFNSARADCLSVVDTVYMAMTRGTTGDVEIHKFVYDGTNYVRPAGWSLPVLLAIGAGTATISQDSAGRLWLAADINGTTQIGAYYTTTDERTWAGPVILDAAATPDFSISAVVAFGGDSVGVFWSNSVQDTYFFQTHRDSDPPAVWQPRETVDSGTDLVDDHLHIQSAPDGRVFAVIKTNRGIGQVNQALYVRSAAGIWGPQVPVNLVGSPVATRPIVNLDPVNNRVYVFYTDEVTGTIDYRTSDMDTLAFGPATTFLAKPGASFNDVSSTKQAYTAASGLLAIATDKNGGTVCFNRKDLVGVDADGDGWTTATDCDDTNPLVNPARQEIVYNGLDDDCNAATRDEDLDQDGYPHTTDCSDTDPMINPGRPEIPYNGKDDDCDAATRDDDLDQDGYPHTVDCDDTDPTVNPGRAEVHNNGKDDDCNPATPDDTVPPGQPSGSGGSLVAVPDLALLLHFDEGTGSETADSSPQSDLGILGSAATGDPKEPTWLPSGRFGPALDFDDFDDQVRVPSLDALKIAGSFTVEAWVARRSPANDFDVILNKGVDDGTPRNYRMAFEADGRLRFFWELQDGTNRDTYSVTTVLDTAWHYIACVYDQAAGQNRIYIDGPLDAQEAKTGTPATNDEQVLIGARDIDGFDDFSGQIDELRISAVARYSASFSPPHGPFTAQQVHLTWTANTETDLAGYNVYRSTASGGPYAKINSSLQTTPEFDDASYASITRYYVVTAVDTTGNESIFSAEVAVGPTGPPMTGDADGDGWFAGSDCDDADAQVNPDVTEVPYNGKDDDCNAATRDDDFDDDGYRIAVDCHDDDPTVNPGVVEVPYNGKDDDCNVATRDDDLDGDGYGIAADCHDDDPAVNPGAVEDPYNGKDDDCNAATRDDDLDGDGYGIAADCRDDDPAVHPGATEVPYNGKDDDCNPGTLDDDLDQDGHPLVSDCNDQNPLVIQVPSEVSFLEVVRSGNDANLTWTSQAAAAGAETIHDLVTGLMSQLAADSGYARASCLAPGRQPNGFLDVRPNPTPGDGWYYLVRAKNSCGTGTFGNSTEAPDPRDALEDTSPCP